MEILGIGGTELVAILIIMLIVAGPKRMIRWAYILGQYTARLRAMWAESMTYIEREFREAGMDVDLPKTPPTRSSINQRVSKALSPVTQPIQEALDETSKQLTQVKQAASAAETNGRTASTTTPASDSSAPDLGTWGGGERVDQ